MLALLHHQWHYECVFSHKAANIHENVPRLTLHPSTVGNLLEISHPEYVESGHDPSSSVGGEYPCDEEPSFSVVRDNRTDDEPLDGLETSSRFLLRLLPQVFDRFDGNKEGEVSIEEINSVLHKLGIQLSRESLVSLIYSVDENHYGSLYFFEFLTLFQSASNDGDLLEDDALIVTNPADNLETDVLSAFQVYDQNMDGFISATDFLAVLNNLGFEGANPCACQLMITQVDTNGDGMVDFSEFKEMMREGSIKRCGIS